MPALSSVGTWLSPNSVAIFAQPPTASFASFLLTQVSFPSADRVRLDLAETEDADRSYQVPRNPIEQLTGQNKIRNPDTLTVTGMLSANPMLSPLTPLGLARLDRRELAKLRKLIDRKALLFVVTPERYFANAVCTRLREHYDGNTGNGVNLTLTFQEMQIVAPGLVDGVLDLDALGVGAGGASDLGPQTPSAVPDPGGLG